MCLKVDFKSPRPSQLCPAITPMIDPPATPSYPAGHAVQAYLISLLLAYSFSDPRALTNLPQHTQRQANSTWPNFWPIFRRAAVPPRRARLVEPGHRGNPLSDRYQSRTGGRVSNVHRYPEVASIWGAGGLRNEVRSEFPQYLI